MSPPIFALPLDRLAVCSPRSSRQVLERSSRRCATACIPPLPLPVLCHPHIVRQPSAVPMRERDFPRCSPPAPGAHSHVRHQVPEYQALPVPPYPPAPQKIRNEPPRLCQLEASLEVLP